MRHNASAAHLKHERPVAPGLPIDVEQSFEAEASQFAPGQWSEGAQVSYPIWGTSLLPPAVSNDEIATEFSEKIQGLSKKQAGKIGGRTPEAGKAWLAALAAPDSASMITAARRYHKVRAWLLWKVAGDWSRVMSPEVLTQLQALLIRMADGNGADAKVARNILQEIHRPSAGTEASAQAAHEHKRPMPATQLAPAVADQREEVPLEGRERKSRSRLGESFRGGQ